MADDGDGPDNFDWPIPKFYFRVKFESLDGPSSFQEVQGLDAEPEVIEFIPGDSPNFNTANLSGTTRSGNVTMRKGVFGREQRLIDYFNLLNAGPPKRENVVIQLLDETDSPVMTWTLTGAFPTKISGIDLQTEGDEVALESMELAYERLIISNG